jgi:hypothetical protein
LSTAYVRIPLTHVPTVGGPRWTSDGYVSCEVLGVHPWVGLLQIFDSLVGRCFDLGQYQMEEHKPQDDVTHLSIVPLLEIVP